MYDINWNGQVGQDRFAAEATGYKLNGSYLELGAGPPVECNNTYALTRSLGWTGVSVDHDPGYVKAWRQERPGDLVVEADALTLNYHELTEGYVDYLQIDLEPPQASLEALDLILKQGVRFKALTFEHDDDEHVRRTSRTLLLDAGYTLWEADVLTPHTWGSRPFEDWWVDLR